MAINNTFLDEKGLRDLLAAIDKKFKSKKGIRIDAGFVPCKISPDGNGNLVVKDDTGRLVQNKFYWCDVPVKTIEFAPYETIDSKVVGEIMMYTPVASDAPDKTMTTSETWSWVGSDSVVKSNSKTLVSDIRNTSFGANAIGKEIKRYRRVRSAFFDSLQAFLQPLFCR